MGMEWLTGSPGGMQQMSTLTPQQQAMQNQLIGDIGGPMNSGLQWLQQLISQDPEAMAQFEAPMMRNFEQNTVPMIAERFAGMGSHGAQNSSAMQQTMGQAGKELQESLGALRGQLGMGAMSQLQNLLSQSMQPSLENIYMQPTQGLAGQALGGGMNLLGMYAGSKFLPK